MQRTVRTPNTQVRNLRPTQVKQLSEGHTRSLWQSQELKLHLLNPSLVFLTMRSSMKSLDGETGLQHKISPISEGAPSTSPAGIPSLAGGGCSPCRPCHCSSESLLSHVATGNEEFCPSATVLYLIRGEERSVFPSTSTW